VKKLALLIDGGCLRKWAAFAGKNYEPDLIEQVAKACVGADEELFRVLYYDCPPYLGTVKNPISGTLRQFTGSDRWLDELAKRDFFAVRRGSLKFRGWEPKVSGTATTDADFKPTFEQKGVDMRIGLDIASFCATRAVDRLALLTADTDMVPALKYARQAGLQAILIGLNAIKTPQTDELTSQVDLHRTIGWPL
jgi:uncharacterized LabA/DUF88 family protein